MQAPDGIQSTYLNDGDEIIVGDTRMQVTIRTDVFCVECGKPIPLEHKARAAFVGHTYICDICRQRSDIQASEAGEDTHFSYTTDAGRHEVLCVRCRKDVTEEAGLRGQVPGAEYVCKDCRLRETTGPVELIEKMLNAAVSSKAPGDSFSIQGYHIEKKIARGGMGMVYKAVNKKTGQPVAIKTMLPHVAANPEGIRTFQREIDVTRQLKHLNIVELLEHGKAEGTFYFVLEFVDGPDLYQLMKSKEGRLSLQQAAPIMLDTLDGLAYAHQVSLRIPMPEGREQTFTGIVHRDLKPQNILLASHGAHWRPKIADFGTAKSFESAGLTDMTVPGDVLGTPMYWPREQITHYKFLNPATDVFSMAAVFYEMLTGVWMRDGFQEMFERCKQQKRPPSISDYMKVIAGNRTVPIRKRHPDIPEPVANVLDRALQETEVPHEEHKMRAMLADLRYPDAGAFRDALVKAFEQAEVVIDRPEEKSQQEKGPQKLSEEQGSPLEALLSELNSSSSNNDQVMLYSVMQPSSSREVALLVVDVVQSSEYIREFGDTYFSNLISSIYQQIKNHYLASDLVFLKTTGDGFLAVFHTIETAFLIASDLLNNPLHDNVSLRIAMHWGSVKTGPDGDVLGVEVHRVFRVESVQSEDLAEESRDDMIALPRSNRILATPAALQQMNATDRLEFQLAGKFHLKGFDTLCELWVCGK
jgi:serine/threonine-protein kinase